MKKIRILLLTLAIGISMLAPEFSMLPAVYAQDETPALAQLVDGGEPEADAAVDPEGGSTSETPAEPETPQSSRSSYDKFYMTDLDDEGAIKIPVEAQDKITISHTEYGNGLLFAGTVADLNSTYINLGCDFDFNEGSIGRLTFDGLKDKDRGMTVEVQVYLDDCKSPTCTFELKKQMGKQEWANDGEKSVSMGTGEITGKHRVSLLLKISGKKDSAKTSVMLRSFQFCRTTVPVMYFNIDESEGTIQDMNSSDDHSVECYGTVDLIVPDAFNADESFRDEYSEQESLYNMDLEYIRGRGNSTWMDDKKPYKVKFDKSQDLFGFGKNRHWTLLANRYDNSLIRNRMTYWLGRQLGMEYTPQCVPVEVVMNGEYYGSYLLCEQIRVGEGRVEIDDLDKADLPVTDELIETGGYLLSLDGDAEEKRQFSTDGGQTFCIESPDDNVAYFSEYIKAYTQKVENAIYGDNFCDADGHSYTEYLDLNAAADYWWVQEFSCNGDAYLSGSTYLYKKRDSETGRGKLYWGPLWDFDYVAWGDLDYGAEVPETLGYTHNPWFEAMKSDPEFIEKVKDRYSEEGGLRDKMVEITKEGGRLDMYLAQMEATYNYDHDKWGAYESEMTEYKGEIEQLREWINKRIGYVDEAIEAMKNEHHKVTFVIDGKVVKEMTANGFIYGRDFPEAPEKAGYRFQGWFNADDEEYTAGYKVTEDVTLTARYINESDIPKPQQIFFKNYEVYYGVTKDSEDGGYGGYYMDYQLMPSDAEESGIVWKSSDESIASVDNEGSVQILGLGDVTITATLPNGISKSYVLHILDDRTAEWVVGCDISRTSMTLKPGGYSQLFAVPIEEPIMEPNLVWFSLDDNIATVDDMGLVIANSPGTTYILMLDTESSQICKCKVTVLGNSNVGRTVRHNGSTYKITSDKAGSMKAMLVKAKNASSVVIPATVKLGGKAYSVTKIKAKAFAKSKATKLTVKTKKLSKARVKGALKGAKIKKIKVKVGKKKTNRKYVKKYKKIFTKKNAGRKVKVY